jgi:membrane protein implicated in regulation of membrane protease activity
MRNERIPWFLWPLAALVRLLAFVIGLCGRMIAAVMGCIFMVAGAVIAFYLVPVWWVGITMVAVGFLLLVRSMF